MKKVAFAIVLLILAVTALEVGLNLVYRLVRQRSFPFREYEASRQRAAAPSPDEPGQAAGEYAYRQDVFEVIHPYLGFVRDPKRSPDTSFLGFPKRGDSDDPFRDKRAGTLVVAVLGGSFAETLAVHGRPALRAGLRRDRDLVLVNLSMGGFKQPQQLFTLGWLLTHGAQLDVVVNLDGFNEVALPPSENVPGGVNPFYPRAWAHRLRGVHDRVALRALGQVMVIEETRRRWAAAFDALPAWSVMRNLAWRVRDTMLEADLAEATLGLQRAAGSSRFVVTGPDLGGPEDLYRRIADHWKTSSRLMKALCDAHGIAYVHLLQPNQYVAGSKTFTADERAKVVDPAHPYRPGVIAGYPQLVAAGRELRARGVDFHDLTMIYRDVPEPIWADSCCHPNVRGYELVSTYLARVIEQALAGRRAPGPAR